MPAGLLREGCKSELAKLTLSHLNATCAIDMSKNRQASVLPQGIVSQHYSMGRSNGANADVADCEEELEAADVAGVAVANHRVWLSELHGRPSVLKLATAS